MLRMVNYGEMNTLLMSAASPTNRCVSKKVAIDNGTSEEEMTNFENRNSGQSFPNSRLIPIWPIEQSQFSTQCTYPCDSSRIRIEPIGSDTAVNGKPNGDSYLAGYDYTFENVPSWLTIERRSATNFHGNNGQVWDEGVYIYAEDIPENTRRLRYITVVARENPQTMAAAEAYAAANGLEVCKTVCERSRILVMQQSENDYGNTYTGLDRLTFTATSGTVENNTRINIALQSDEQVLSGGYFANGGIVGSISSEYSSVASASGTIATIDIAQLRSKFTDTTGTITFNVYGTWEGSGPSAVIPVPTRDSYRVDAEVNGSVLYNPNMKSCGNMNIGGIDIDSVSNVVSKLKARCACIGVIKYSPSTDTVTIENSISEGIRPVFYPTSLTNMATNETTSFVWAGSGSSTNRDFNPIEINSGVFSIDVTSKNGSSNCRYGIYMAPNTGSDSYIINGQQVTSGNTIYSDISSFTIDLSDSSYKGKTHRFYLRQEIQDASLQSGNASPEYAVIHITVKP